MPMLISLDGSVPTSQAQKVHLVEEDGKLKISILNHDGTDGEEEMDLEGFNVWVHIGVDVK